MSYRLITTALLASLLAACATENTASHYATGDDAAVVNGRKTLLPQGLAILNDRRRNPFSRNQDRNARRIAGHRFRADAAGRRGKAHRFPSAEHRFARRQRQQGFCCRQRHKQSLAAGGGLDLTTQQVDAVAKQAGNNQPRGLLLMRLHLHFMKRL